MIYRQHIEDKTELIETMKLYSEILDEKRELFQRTQPSSVDMDHVGKTQRSGTGAVDSYLIQSERRNIDERLKEAREIVEAAKKRLEDDELLLGMSMETIDQVYFMRYVERRGVSDIAARLHYSQSYVFKTLKQIEKSERV